MECGGSKLRVHTRSCPGLRPIRTSGNRILTYLQATQLSRNPSSLTHTAGLERNHHRNGPGSLGTKKHTRNGHCVDSVLFWRLLAERQLCFVKFVLVLNKMVLVLDIEKQAERLRAPPMAEHEQEYEKSPNSYWLTAWCAGHQREVSKFCDFQRQCRIDRRHYYLAWYATCTTLLALPTENF